MESLRHNLVQAGNAQLMTTGLMQTLCDHAMGNYRVLCTMANELLTVAAQKEKPQLDESLFFECFAPPMQPRPSKNKISASTAVR